MNACPRWISSSAHSLFPTELGPQIKTPTLKISPFDNVRTQFDFQVIPQAFGEAGGMVGCTENRGLITFRQSFDLTGNGETIRDDHAGRWGSENLLQIVIDGFVLQMVFDKGDLSRTEDLNAVALPFLEESGEFQGGPVEFGPDDLTCQPIVTGGGV